MAQQLSARADETTLQPAYLVGALSAGAAVIHLMMAPVHASSSQVDALLFALAGWFQITVALLVVFRPARRWLAVAGIGNAVILAAWVWSRTKGLPFGGHPWEPEAVGGVDLTAALFEAGVIVGALGHMLPKPVVPIPKVVSAAAALVVIAITTAVLINPTTSDHHDDGGQAEVVLAADVVSTPARCDESLNPVAYWEEAKLAGTDGTTPVTAAATTATAGGHTHGAAAAPAATTTPTTPTTPTTLGPLKGRGSEQYDTLLKLAGQPGEAAAGFLIAELANATDDEYHEFIASLNPATAPAGHDAAAASGNNSDATSHTMSHLGPQAWKPMSDPADCGAVADELAQTKAVAMKYPTAADAIAGGYRRVAPYVPGIASHWMKFAAVDGTFAIDDPEMLLYDGNSEASHIVGVSYYIVMEGDTAPSQGFTGDNDLSHRHIGLCSKPGGGVIGDSTTSDEECAALGGRKANGGSGWMSHAWVVPGCESPWGVFSGINPLLDKATGDASGTNAGGCAASAVRDRYDLSAGAPETMPTTTTTPSETEEAAGS